MGAAETVWETAETYGRHQTQDKNEYKGHALNTEESTSKGFRLVFTSIVQVYAVSLTPFDESILLSQERPLAARKPPVPSPFSQPAHRIGVSPSATPLPGIAGVANTPSALGQMALTGQ